MKKLLLASAIAAIFASAFAQTPVVTPAPAATAAPAAEEKKPDHEVSFNVGLATDYRYRGISQSGRDPALSAGADYTHNPTGLYAGTWISSIKWIHEAGGSNTNTEVDLYFGKKGDLGKGVSYDVGGLYYWYPSNDLGSVPGFVKADTFELYGKLTYGPAYVKTSVSTTDTFGWIDSKGSVYLDLGYDYDMGSGYTLNLHGGRQWINNNSVANYFDWKVGVSKEFFGVGFNLAWIGTDAEKIAYTSPATGKFLGESMVVLTATKTF